MYGIYIWTLLLLSKVIRTFLVPIYHTFNKNDTFNRPMPQNGDLMSCKDIIYKTADVCIFHNNVDIIMHKVALNSTFEQNVSMHNHYNITRHRN